MRENPALKGWDESNHIKYNNKVLVFSIQFMYDNCMKQMKARTFNLSDEIYQKLHDLAQIQGRTVSELVREALIKLLKDYDN